MKLELKLANETSEFEQIHQLNYLTFVEEIPQHHPNTEKRLIDPFHSENTYVIALHEQKLVGMLALREQRPFSLDNKLACLDQYLPPCNKPVEIRLLSVLHHVRKTRVFFSLLNFSIRYGLQQGYDLALISGTTRQQKLYLHLGFIPFGPLVGSAVAAYQPMYLTQQAFQQTLSKSEAMKTALQELLL